MKKFTLLLLVVCTLSCSKKSDDSDEYQPTSGILKYLVESDLDSFQVTYKGINGETITTTVSGQNVWQYEMQSSSGQNHFISYQADSGESVVLSIIYKDNTLKSVGCSGAPNIQLNCNAVVEIP